MFSSFTIGVKYSEQRDNFDIAQRPRETSQIDLQLVQWFMKNAQGGLESVI